MSINIWEIDGAINLAPTVYSLNLNHIFESESADREVYSYIGESGVLWGLQGNDYIRPTTGSNTLIQIGGIPGVADTPAGVPGPYGPPVPPIYDGFVKHFPYMTVYNVALMAGVSAALAAAFPPTAPASVGAFAGSFSAAIATMGMPPVGRPLTMVGIG